MTNEVATMTPEIRTLVIGRADITAYRDAILTEGRARVSQLRAGVQEAESAWTLADEMPSTAPRQAGMWKGQLTRRRHQLAKAEKYVNAIEDGYLPIPRLPVVRLDYVTRLLPPEALQELKIARDTHNFEWFGIIDGNDASRAGYPRSWGRNRDPILVGMILGEPFPLAWWR